VHECVCGALTNARCVCDQMGWTIAVYPVQHAHDCKHATWNGWTASIGAHQERIMAFKRPKGYSKRGYAMTFREWAERQGAAWTERKTRVL
jgi:hypothetical protein